MCASNGTGSSPQVCMCVGVSVCACVLCMHSVHMWVYRCTCVVLMGACLRVCVCGVCCMNIVCLCVRTLGDQKERAEL